MTTSFPMTAPWTGPTNGIMVDAAMLQTYVTTAINDLYNLTATTGNYVGQASSSTSTTLSTTSAFASTAYFTFTLSITTRVRIYFVSQFVMNGGTNGVYVVQAAYNSGSSPSIGSATTVPGVATTCSLAATALRASATSEGTALLTAGTYTAYGSVQRLSGGGVTDIAGNNYVNVISLGNV